jgi:peroxiredoxin
VNQFKDKPFALIGVHVGGSSVKQLKEIMEKNNLNWRSFADEGNAGAGPIATKWNLSATPTFYLLDHKGVIRYKWAGPPGAKILDEALDVLIKAAEAGSKPPRN